MLGDERLPPNEQFRAAQAFLEEYREDLARLRGWPRFEAACLTVSYTVPTRAWAFGVILPAALVALAGGLGFGLGVTVLSPPSGGPTSPPGPLHPAPAP